jgi:hypothetical protein
MSTHGIQLTGQAFRFSHFEAALARVGEKIVVHGAQAAAGQRDKLFVGEIGARSSFRPRLACRRGEQNSAFISGWRVIAYHK